MSTSIRPRLSFKVGDFDQLKEIFGRVRHEGITAICQTRHGHALSIYFPDPEGNQIEIYMVRPGTCRSRTACRSTCHCRTTKSRRRTKSTAAKPPASCHSTSGRQRSMID